MEVIDRIVANKVNSDQMITHYRWCGHWWSAEAVIFEEALRRFLLYSNERSFIYVLIGLSLRI